MMSSAKKPKKPSIFKPKKVVKKRDFALRLLIQGKTNTQVNVTLKNKFGKGLSNRDLKKIRSIIVKLPRDALIYVNAFKECFGCLIGNDDPAFKKVLEKYNFLYWDIVKDQLLQQIPNSIRTSDGILNGFDSIQALAEGKSHN